MRGKLTFTAIIVSIVIFVTPHPVIYFYIVAGVDVCLSFGNGFLGIGLEMKDPLYMNSLELRIRKGTATISDRIKNFIAALIFGILTSYVHIISLVLYLITLGVMKLF